MQTIKYMITISEQSTRIIAIVVGVVLLSIAQALQFMPENAQVIVVAVIRVVGYAIAIPGWYSIAKDEWLKR